LLQKTIIGNIKEEPTVIAEAVNANPAIKLLNFYEALWAGDQAKARLSLEKTLKVSEKMQALKPIEMEWVSGWVKDWLQNRV
jgi:hypothetical protein